MTDTNPALQALRAAVTGRIERGQSAAIVEIPTMTTTAQADPLMKGWARLMRQHVDSCAKHACGLCAKYGHEASAAK